MNSGIEPQDPDKLHAHNLDHQRQKVARGRHLEEALRTRRVLWVGKSHAKSAHGRSQYSECALLSHPPHHSQNAAMSEMQESPRPAELGRRSPTVKRPDWHFKQALQHCIAFVTRLPTHAFEDELRGETTHKHGKHQCPPASVGGGDEKCARCTRQGS